MSTSLNQTVSPFCVYHLALPMHWWTEMVYISARPDLLPHHMYRAVQYATIGRQRQAMSWLMANDANVNQQDSAGNAALHFAAHSGQAEFVGELLDLSADPTLKTKA